MPLSAEQRDGMLIQMSGEVHTLVSQVSAIYEDLEELRIIHGKGTGALRQRVGELLKNDSRVRAYRMGGPTEGGAGVTVATLREGAR